MKRLMACSRVRPAPALVAVLAALLACGASAAWGQIDLMDLRRDTGATLEWDPWLQQGLLLRRGATVAFRVGLPWAVIDYDRRLDIGPVIRQGASIRFTAAGAERIAAVLNPPRTEGALRVAAIMVDPGHGGKDPGAVGRHRFGGRRVTVMEKDIVLDVGKRLYALLTKDFPDKRVLITRDDDFFVVLEERSVLANDELPEEPDVMLFISIHANAAFRAQATGFEVWVLPESHERNLLPADRVPSGDRDVQPIFNAMLDEQISRESVVLANRILDGLDARVGARSKNRGIRDESFAVLRHSRMPAVLVELGFVSNPAEARLMTQDDYLNDLTQGIYDGVTGFIEWFESSPGDAG